MIGITNRPTHPRTQWHFYFLQLLTTGHSLKTVIYHLPPVISYQQISHLSSVFCGWWRISFPQVHNSQLSPISSHLSSVIQHLSPVVEKGLFIISPHQSSLIWHLWLVNVAEGHLSSVNQSPFICSLQPSLMCYMSSILCHLTYVIHYPSSVIYLIGVLYSGCKISDHYLT